MNLPFVSVIIPTFNRKNLCKRATDSVLNQTYRDFELIVVDDGSTDGTTADFLFKEPYNRYCRFIHQETNCGVSAARNRGVSESRGEWIAFLDSDDEWHPQKLAKQVAWINSHPDYNIVQTKEVWIRKGKRVNPPKTHEKIAGHIFRESLERCMITPSSVMIKKDFFLKKGAFNESLPACEDYDLWLRITLNDPVGLVDEFLLTRYGGHSDQLSSSVGILDKFRIRALLNLMEHEQCSKKQKLLIYQTLVAKATVVANGSKKRDKVEEYERFRKIADSYKKLI